MLEGNMNTDTTENWLPDFLDEVGLPQHAVFRGYVLYNDEQERFLAINTLAPERARSHYVESCAWAHRYHGQYIRKSPEPSKGAVMGEDEACGLFRPGR